MILKTLTVVALTMVLTSCASVTTFLKGGADVGVAYASFGDCRSEWESFVPAEVRAQVSDEVAVLDQHIASLNAVTQSNPNITLVDAAAKIVNGANIKSDIETGYKAIEKNAVDYAISIGTDNQMLITCADTLKSAWSGVFDSSGGAKVVEVLTALAPYAKYLPLLLESDNPNSDGVRLASA